MKLYKGKPNGLFVSAVISIVFPHHLDPGVSYVKWEDKSASVEYTTTIMRKW